jgi:CxxC motif-containing protein (DUF1111 family)
MLKRIRLVSTMALVGGFLAVGTVWAGMKKPGCPKPPVPLIRMDQQKLPPCSPMPWWNSRMPDSSLDQMFPMNPKEMSKRGRHDRCKDVLRVSDCMLFAPAIETPGQAPGFGQPLPGLTPMQSMLFQQGKTAFETVETVADGLGPLFNGNSCGQCHARPATGGGNDLFENRIGRISDDLQFDPLTGLGGSLRQLFTIGDTGTRPGCFFPAEVVPPQANVSILRRSLALSGDGLVDNVPDSIFFAIAMREQMHFPLTAGRVSTAVNLAQSFPAVAKFGWKAQVPNLFQFAGNAYVNEMGITNPEFPLENCPNDTPNCPLMQRCNPVPGLNDNGEDVTNFTNFMTLLAPPPRGPIDNTVRQGGRIFVSIGCANCHLPTLRTGPNAVAALDRKIFHPYSDFLIHDMGSLGDSTSGDQGDASFVLAIATPREMRTQPLWGVRVLDRFLHDGRATTLSQAILAHDGQGACSREAFRNLNPQQVSRLLAFLNSL